jgi:hypothetical protein
VKPVEENGPQRLPPVVEPCCRAALSGGLPHTDPVRGTRLILEHTPEIPAWAAFPKKNPSEQILRQFSEGLPGLVREDECDCINTELPDFLNQTVLFYRRYLAVMEQGDEQAWEAFALNADYASGFQEFVRQLPDHLSREKVVMLKGQVTGPVTLGINILDQDRRCAYYDEQLRDILVKTAALKAVWQIRQWKTFGLPILICIDEPALLLLGRSVFLSIERRDVIKDINEVAAAVHAFGGLVGVRGEENTDWSMLLSTEADFLTFDAFGHFQSLTLYPDEVRSFLERGGCLGWGLIPILEQKPAVSPMVPFLLGRFEEGLERLTQIFPDRDLLLRRSLITFNSGGGGGVSEAQAERALGLLRDVSRAIRRRYGLV